MTEQDIYTRVAERFGDAVVDFMMEGTQNPTIIVKPEAVREICTYLRDDEALKFDALMNLAGHDPAPGEDLSVIYHLHAIELNHYITLKTFCPREGGKVASVAEVYPTADWHERETYDLFGIEFAGHPDLKRILMEEDWEGYPLLKDYVPAEFYRGMRIEKEH